MLPLPLRLVPLVLASALSFALLACTGGEEDGPGTPAPIVPTAEITLTASPEPTGTASPGAGEPRRTGDPQLDAIIEAVEARDVAALARLVVMPTLACTQAEGFGGPPKCEEGIPEGTEVQVFPTAACEGGWTRWGVQAVGQFAHETDGAWAVARVNRYWPSTDGWEAPDHFVFFHSIRGQAGDIGGYLEVADGRIVRANWICGGGLEGILGVDAFDLEVIAGPWEEPQPGPEVDAPATGIEAVDGILAAVARYDWVSLREGAREAMQDLPPQACEVDPTGPGAFQCGPKDQPGDLVPVFPIAYCEGSLARDPGDVVRSVLDGVPSLYAVVEAPSEPSPSDLYRHGAYWIVYEFEHPRQDQASQAVRLHVTADGNIIAVWFGCVPPVHELVQWDGQPLPEVEVREE